MNHCSEFCVKRPCAFSASVSNRFMASVTFNSTAEKIMPLRGQIEYSVFLSKWLYL